MSRSKQLRAAHRRRKLANATKRVAKAQKKEFNKQQERERKKRRSKTPRSGPAKPKAKAGLTPVSPGKYVDARGQTWVDVHKQP